MCAPGKSAHFGNISGIGAMLRMKNEPECGCSEVDGRWVLRKIYNMT